MMKILLAGYNIDCHVLGELIKNSKQKQDLTPETISAAYARISRSPKPVDELRRDACAEVEKARKSNRNIVFEMGHSSVAEHAVFNIDVIGVSRLLVEEIEKFRLCSYTEKSQRYVLFDKDFVVPEEIAETGLTDLFVSMVSLQNDFYHRLYKRLRPYVFEQNKEVADHPANRSMLEGWAKEDARYAISLATETQLGMTINARNLELMLRRLKAHPLVEARIYSDQLYEVTHRIAPSLIRYTEPTIYDRQARRGIQGFVGGLCRSGESPRRDVVMNYATPEADAVTTAALLFASSGLPYAKCWKEAKCMSLRRAKALFQSVFENMQSYEAVLRETENVDLQFELILSASCFAQLKRHRMATIVCQNYDPALGVTVPPSVKAIGLQKEFMSMIAKTNRVYEIIKQKNPAAAAYVLTNAHRRRVLMKCNARELYHFVRLRADSHAQWDIRQLSENMLKLAQKAMPLTLMMACGKDGFTARRKKIYFQA